MKILRHFFKLEFWLFAIIIGVAIGAIVVEVAHADVGNDAQVSWTAVTQDVNNNALTSPALYNVYQSLNGGSYVKIDSKLTVLTKTYANLPPGSACYKVSCETLVNPEGAQSSPACKNFSFPAAGSTTVTVK